VVVEHLALLRRGRARARPLGLLDRLPHPHRRQRHVDVRDPQRTQGVAQALFEEAVYDEDGNLLTSSMTNYLVPSAAELPSFELDRTETPSPTNPLGVKGVGETGAIASPAAVMNAVADALAPRGVTDIDMPATPERVWRALEEARR